MGFFERELRDRKELGYPPFSRMVLARVDALDEKEAQAAAAVLARAARVGRALTRTGRRADALDVRGPAPRRSRRSATASASA